MSLYLIPNTLGTKNRESFSLEVLETIPKLQGIIAESEGGGRTFLRIFKIPKADTFPLAIFNKQFRISYLDFLLQPVIDGEHWGFISDAGLPCIADPGSLLVKRARERNISVRVFSGECSLTMALMLSGFDGKQFVFLGYPPQNIKEKRNFFKNCEEESQKYQRAILLIETPYRNKYTFLSCLEHLRAETYLSVNCHLTMPDEYVETLTIEQWRKLDSESLSDNLAKKPTVFIIYAKHNDKTHKNLRRRHN